MPVFSAIPRPGLPALYAAWFRAARQRAPGEERAAGGPALAS